MRCAQFICFIPKKQIEEIKTIIGAYNAPEDAPGEAIPILGTRLDDEVQARRVAEIVAPKAVQRIDYQSPHLYYTGQIGRHTDDGFYEWTVGAVLEGDHYLVTGNGRKVCDLVPGTVYLVHRRKTHGALRRDRKSNLKLVFVAFNFKAISIRDALSCVT